MSTRTWVILGATSIIAEEFARCAARSGHALLLVGRNQRQLNMIASDIRLRHAVHCEAMVVDFAEDIPLFLETLRAQSRELDLFIASSDMCNNDQLTDQSFTAMLTVNVTHTSQLIHAYWHKPQSQHRLVFLSSVAACRGRAKNSLYGASKAAIEVYLQGLQQGSAKTQHITLARLGFIDTHATFGEPGIFYASPPKACAHACWKAVHSKKRMIYHPFFWRYIMWILRHLPHFIYEKIRV